MRKELKAIIIILCIVSWMFCAIECHAYRIVGQSSKQVELANAALKKIYENRKLILSSTLSQIQTLIKSHDFKALENLYDDFFHRYKKDVIYESFLVDSYTLFSPKNDISIEDLDLWVAKTGSYIAYAARGKYRAKQGFEARGEKAISEIPDNKIDEMQRFHNDAAKDLQIAIKMEPSFMPAYHALITIAKTSSMPFSARQVVDKAEKYDKRTYEVRLAYMYSLQPRWGGSYEEMAAFAEHAIGYSDLNPLLWTLQGEVDADRADDYYRERNYKAAIELYSQALKFGVRTQWLKRRAGCYYYLGMNDESVADYKKVLNYNPTDSEALRIRERR